MLFKISINNIRKSLRDYAIYFFTLVIGVAVFYVFNAINSQTAFLMVSQDTRDIMELLNTMLSGVSYFVSAVLGLLIVYASRFLMKRRNKEFALYLILGMGKSKISAILLAETFIIGIGSLVVGLILGTGASQLMSVLVANLFEADMTSYRFNISAEAIIKTIIYFGIMYVVVMIFNSIMISKCKLIDLMQSDKKSEKMKLKSPAFCTVIFIIAAAALGYAYYRVTTRSEYLSNKILVGMIIVGIISTFLIFWSVSGLLLHIVRSSKSVYFRSLNCFTFRQISSKINTTVMSMTVICLMLFVTICALSSAFSVRNSMNANLNELAPVDFAMNYSEKYDGKIYYTDIFEEYEKAGIDPLENVSEYIHLKCYQTDEFTFADFAGEDILKQLQKISPFLDTSYPEDIVKSSDYNKLAELYGTEKFSLENDEYVLICDFKSMKEIRDHVIANGGEIEIFGQKLKPKYTECQDGFVDIGSQHINSGIFIVPDEIIGNYDLGRDYFIGNYKAETKEEKYAAEEKFEENYKKVFDSVYAGKHADPVETNWYFASNTRIDIAEATIGLGAMAALLGLYVGLVFLISCGAVLALKELSESADSVRRYEILRKIGADEKEISRSLFRQTGIFFLLPMLLAAIHSVFGMKFAMFILEVFGTEKLIGSVAFTSIVVLMIYGGYFLITYFCSLSIIECKRK